MLRRILALLGARTERGEHGEHTDAGEEGDGKGFTPSRLDASVLEAHGMGHTAAERELANIEEKARVLEDEQPDQHPPDDHSHERP